MRLKSFVVDEQGNYRPNQLLEHVKPYWLTIENRAQTGVARERVQMTANAQSPPMPMNVSDDGAFQGALLTCERWYACTVDLKDQLHGVGLTASPVHVDTLFGGHVIHNITTGQGGAAASTGIDPMVLPETIWLERRESIVFQATDISGQQLNQIQPVIHGQRIMTGRARDAALDKYVLQRVERARHILPYVAPLHEVVTLEAQEGAIATWVDQNVVEYFEQDAIGHFDVLKINYVASQEFKFQVVDESGQQLTRGWVHCFAGLGSARAPMLTFGPWRIQAGGHVKFIFSNWATEANTIYMTLIGRIILV